MSTLLMKLHTETERCKEECNRKEIVCPHVPGHHAAQLSLIARGKTYTAKTSNHERNISLNVLAITLSYNLLFPLLFSSAVLDSQIFHWCDPCHFIPIHAMPNGYFSSVSAKGNSGPTFLLLDIKDADNHIVQSPHMDTEPYQEQKPQNCKQV